MTGVTMHALLSHWPGFLLSAFASEISASKLSQAKFTQLVNAYGPEYLAMVKQV